VKIYHFETLNSTQDTAKEYMAEGRECPFAIIADRQAKGRGRLGNEWVSEEGNLLTSIVIPLQNIAAKNAGQYSFLTSVALMDCLKDYGVSNAMNKWPNDILVEGKKIAGILLESDIGTDGFINFLIIGVGVNLVSAPEGAICIHELTGDSLSPSEFLSQFVKQLNLQMLFMEQRGFTSIRQKWLDTAYGIGQVIKIRLPNEIFYGEFIGLDEEGALLVSVDGHPRKVYSGDVFFEGKFKDASGN
jgi:BirA family transcriptional regulator, biotin operon repressor / biotin---[acetyl-CoA-carboxylase] ligase